VAAPIETGAHSTMRGLLRETDRITVVSLAQISDELSHGLLCALDLELPDSGRTIGYTLRKDWHPSLPQRRFLDILRAVATESRRKTE
jgi:LysR family transcriptional regulator of gallate degradation